MERDFIRVGELWEPPPRRRARRYKRNHWIPGDVLVEALPITLDEALPVLGVLVARGELQVRRHGGRVEYRRAP